MALLSWYDEKGRSLPWRIRPEDRQSGAVPNPYKIWLSEIMCQQTTVAAVIPYWEKFTSQWPSVGALANADIDVVLTAWAGLGYYARARNLHKCANIIASEMNGKFPKSETDLLKLPGIGPYSAAAIAAICSEAPTNVVDGNVERVMARLHAVETKLPHAKPTLKGLAAHYVAPDRASDWPQALMDLGARICRPKSPKCELCPLSDFCLARQKGDPQIYPKRMPKVKRPSRFGAAFYLVLGDKVLLEKRPSSGLLGGMMQLPGTEWLGEMQNEADILAAAPTARNWEKIDNTVVHVFTHFTLELKIYRATIAKSDINIAAHQVWAELDRLENFALPSLMQKAVKLAHQTKN